MGCTASSPLDERDELRNSKRTNDEIERALLLGQQKEKKQVKLLLLGTGESGKSTVLKQMRLLHQGGFTYQERVQYAQVIWADAIQSMRILIVQARKLGIPLDCDQPGSPLKKYKQNILRYRALEDVDTDMVGGSDFLSDYVLKYSERGERQRRQKSDGIAGSGWEREGSEQDDELDASEISQGLNEGVVPRPMRSPNVRISRADIAESITALWERDRGIQQCFFRSNEFQLEGSASYYFEKINQLADPSYVCQDEDILKGRIKTTGITETIFNIGMSQFKFLDAGGQRSERKKWIHCFEGITAVIFVMAVSEYDQMLFEDHRVNRMKEAIVLFHSLCNSRWFKNTPFILFMNKVDLFEKKIARSPIRHHFPDYRGKNVEEALEFFENIFLGLNENDKPIYVHRTCATDTKSMKFVLTAVTDSIIQQNLKNSGMI